MDFALDIFWVQAGGGNPAEWIEKLSGRLHCIHLKGYAPKGSFDRKMMTAGVYAKAVKKMSSEADRHPEVVFGMIFNQRTNHVYRKMCELVKSGKYGQIRLTNWLITNLYRINLICIYIKLYFCQLILQKCAFF